MIKILNVSIIMTFYNIIMPYNGDIPRLRFHQLFVWASMISSSPSELCGVQVGFFM